MNEYSQDIKIICQNHIIKGSIKASEGHPWRSWKIRVIAVENSREKKGKLNYLLDHVEYMLHPTFENSRRVFMKEPYLLQEKGWGEFDMRVVLLFKNNLAEPENIFFDLHFREPTYTILHKVTFNNPSPELIKLLSIEVPDSIPLATSNNPNSSAADKKRRASPPLSSSKKIKTPPTTSSPFNDGSFNTRYPLSPASNMLQPHYEDSNETDYLFRSMYAYSKELIVDDVYAEKDVEHVNPIHSKQIDDNIRIAWGLPEGLDVLELARRLSMKTPEQSDEIEAMIKSHKKEGMLLEENEDEFIIDLYSLGPDLLNQLWDYTEKKKIASRNSAALSPFSLIQANTSMMEDY